MWSCLQIRRRNPGLVVVSPSRWSERKLSRSAKASGRIRWMVFLDRVKSTSPDMLTKSFPPTSMMKLSASRSSTVRRSTCGGTNRRPLSAHSVLSDSDRLRHTQWKGQAETTPQVSPAPIREGSRQHVTRVSQWKAGNEAESGRVRFVVLGHGQWRRCDGEAKEGTKRGRMRRMERMDGGKGKRSALFCEWGCERGRSWFLQGLRGGGTGMVESLAVHRPAWKQKEKRNDNNLVVRTAKGSGCSLKMFLKVGFLFCFCFFFLHPLWLDRNGFPVVFALSHTQRPRSPQTWVSSSTNVHLCFTAYNIHTEMYSSTLQYRYFSPQNKGMSMLLKSQCLGSFEDFFQVTEENLARSSSLGFLQ